MGWQCTVNEESRYETRSREATPPIPLLCPVACGQAFGQRIPGSIPNGTHFFLLALVCFCIHPFVFWLRVVGFRSVLSVRLHSCFFTSFPLPGYSLTVFLFSNSGRARSLKSYHIPVRVIKADRCARGATNLQDAPAWLLPPSGIPGLT